MESGEVGFLKGNGRKILLRKGSFSYLWSSQSPGQPKKKKKFSIDISALVNHWLEF